MTVLAFSKGEEMGTPQKSNIDTKNCHFQTIILGIHVSFRECKFSISTDFSDLLVKFSRVLVSRFFLKLLVRFFTARNAITCHLAFRFLFRSHV